MLTPEVKMSEIFQAKHDITPGVKMSEIFQAKHNITPDFASKTQYHA